MSASAGLVVIYIFFFASAAFDVKYQYPLLPFACALFLVWYTLTSASAGLRVIYTFTAPALTFVTVNDRDYCQVCADDLFVKCEDCSDHHDISDLRDVHSDGEVIRVCPDCMDDYRLCAVCEEYFDNEHIVQHEGRLYCPECFEKHVCSPVTALMVV
jgi:hypothetical protein